MYTISRSGKKLRVMINPRDINHNQRRNAMRFVYHAQTVSGNSMCNVTAYCHTALANGIILPGEGPFDRYPDRMGYFMLTNKQVDDEWKRIGCNDWADWHSVNNVDMYNPLNIHAMLAFGFNLWTGYQHATFNGSADIYNDILRELLIAGRGVAASLTVVGLGHIVSIRGAEFDLADTQYYTQGTGYDWLKAWISGGAFQDDTILVHEFLRVACVRPNGWTIKPSGFIFDDPYGRTPSSYNNYSAYIQGGALGNEIDLTLHSHPQAT
jgi:hypothetical protein